MFLEYDLQAIPAISQIVAKYDKYMNLILCTKTVAAILSTGPDNELKILFRIFHLL